jgi:hypothetical protein
MGGMGGSMRPLGKSGLSFDRILSRLQGELQKSCETASELHLLTTAMNNIHDTLGGVMVSCHFDRSTNVPLTTSLLQLPNIPHSPNHLFTLHNHNQCYRPTLIFPDFSLFFLTF